MKTYDEWLNEYKNKTCIIKEQTLINKEWIITYDSREDYLEYTQRYIKYNRDQKLNELLKQKN